MSVADTKHAAVPPGRLTQHALSVRLKVLYASNGLVVLSDLTTSSRVSHRFVCGTESEKGRAYLLRLSSREVVHACCLVRTGREDF